MKPRNLRRKIRAIPNSRWAAYAAAGAATALGGINSADAAIHYSGLIDAKFGNFTRTFQLDPAGPAALQFRHNVHYYSTSEKDGGSAFLGVFYGAAAGYSVSCAFNNSLGSVSRLARHDVISQRPFSSRAAVMATVEGFGCGGGPRGQFRTAGKGFIGFRFNNGNGDQYGWARVKMGGSSRNRFFLLDYAYGDPGDQVRAGDLSVDQAPKLESLGGLAIGAAGLLAWRRRRARFSDLEIRVHSARSRAQSFLNHDNASSGPFGSVLSTLDLGGLHSFVSCRRQSRKSLIFSAASR